MISVKCTKCNLFWGTSIKADLSNYVCPVCTRKEIREAEKRKGVISSVLLKNRRKFQTQR